ncbi:MAG: AMP-binding protein [Ruminiclostridium sp.]|nr:AMP-binding protein [Ruminiclostridium sp.]
MAKKKLEYFKVHNIVSLKDMINQSAERYTDCNAFTIKDSNGDFFGITFKQLQDKMNALGTALLDLDLNNSFVSVLSENRFEWCLTYLSVTNGVGIIVPLDKELPANEITSLLNRSGSQAIVTSSHYLDTIIKIKGSVPSLKYIICMDPVDNEDICLSFSKLLEKGAELIKNGDRRYINADIDPDVMNMLIFTSGTTDKSKGVMLSHKNICHDIMAVSQLIYADTNDSILSILPLHHTYECTAGFLTMMYLGVSMSFCEGLRHIPKNLQEYKPTLMMSVPLILESLYSKIIKKARKEHRYRKFKTGLLIASILNKLGIDIRRTLFKEVHDNLGGNLRIVISGAAALNPKISKALRSMGFNLLQGYGLTECSPIVTVNRIEVYNDKSVGLPLAGVDIKIEDPGHDGIGEVLVRGNNIMLGYYGNQEATDEVLKNGWLYTGDYGRIDKKGFLYITGRKKNVIVTKNGKNIYPEDIEIYLNRSEYIKESLVYGVDNDEEEETIVCAQIVPDIEFITDEIGKAPTKEELMKIVQAEVKKVNKKLTGYKKIKHFDIREEEFDKTTTKKIKRYVELLSLNISNLASKLKIK